MSTEPSAPPPSYDAASAAGASSGSKPATGASSESNRTISPVMDSITYGALSDDVSAPILNPGSNSGPTALDLTPPVLYSVSTCYGLLILLQSACFGYAIQMFIEHNGQSCQHPLATWLLVNGITGLVFVLPICCLYCVMVQALTSFTGGGGGWLESLANCGLCLVCGLYCVAFPLAVFSIVWLIVGSVWVYGMDGHDCNEWLYTFTWWYISVSWALLAVNYGVTTRIQRGPVGRFLRGGFTTDDD